MTQAQSTTDDRRIGPLIQAYGEDGILRGYVANGVIILNPDGAAGNEYEIVVAGQTAQVLGPTGAAGDYLSHVIFYPATTGAGTSIVLDGAIEVGKYTAGTLSDLKPIYIAVNAVSVSGAWKVTTGANMTATGFGSFT